MARSHAPGAPLPVPASLRFGGAFLAIAVVLGVMVFLAMSSQGIFALVSVTPRLLSIVVAAGLLGAYAVRMPGQLQTIARPIALGVAVLLVVGSRFLPNPELHVMEAGWLVAYAVTALLAGLLLRRHSVTRG
ncbi:hypothetical protein C1Y63_03125 [Corynebacterium sp. 13CS0277]|uniref:hypothetical protein n=1 Tax=Corynebacterium sp. 13CS0277 TaxID=2071994 RepID=UPI000D037DBA|nr:hypothetical protein [Corynebacterium sp. 13CS0277]PRQ12074.1 hypothetical protein C1Y63_03125 [Corynebacterium sp. 13CS0277]